MDPGSSKSATTSSPSNQVPQVDIMTTTGAKEKKTRKRPRVSCVECTKRRQKCDRQFPCGLCITRGVPHMCRWESGPLARPPPARPPVIPPPPSGREAELTSTIGDLQAQITDLERALANQNQEHRRPSSSNGSYTFPSPSEGGSISTTGSSLSSPDSSYVTPESPPSSVESSPRLLHCSPPVDSLSAEPRQRDVHDAAVTLAQLSLAHHGEYVGSGTIVCALYKLGDHDSARFSFAQSTDVTSPQPQSGIPHTPHPLPSPIQSLLQHLPSRDHTNKLLDAYFSEINWKFGIPETSFRNTYQQMWRTVEGNGDTNVNPHWISLLFSLLALVPHPTDNAKSSKSQAAAYFQHAITARRLGEDASLMSDSFPDFQSPKSSIVDGTVLSCVAAPVLAAYLADRGLVSEGWKLIGAAIRTAFAVGMHRDPSWGRWLVMCDEERLLRRRGWWALFIWDRLYSYVLGRPAMIRESQFDVFMPAPTNQDGSRHSYGTFEMELIKLTKIAGEAGNKCLSIQSPTYATVLEIDRQFVQWEKRLPVEFQWRSQQVDSDRHSSPTRHSSKPPPTQLHTEPDPSSAANKFTISRQRHTLATWYTACRMNLHRPYLTDAAPPVLPVPAGLVFPPGNKNTVILNPSQERCIEMAMELVEVQLTAHAGDGVYTDWNDNSTGGNRHAGNGKLLPGETFGFADTFLLFDAAVTLMGALAQVVRVDERAKRCQELVQRAVWVLGKAMRASECAAQGEIARRAIAVLYVLKRQQEKVKSLKRQYQAEDREGVEEGSRKEGGREKPVDHTPDGGQPRLRYSKDSEELYQCQALGKGVENVRHVQDARNTDGQASMDSSPRSKNPILQPVFSQPSHVPYPSDTSANPYLPSIPFLAASNMGSNTNPFGINYAFSSPHHSQIQMHNPPSNSISSPTPMAHYLNPHELLYGKSHQSNAQLAIEFNPLRVLQSDLSDGLDLIHDDWSTQQPNWDHIGENVDIPLRAMPFEMLQSVQLNESRKGSW